MNPRHPSTNIFSKSLVLLGCMIAFSGWAAWQSSTWAQEETERTLALLGQAEQLARAAAQAEASLAAQDASMPSVRHFLQSWTEHLKPNPKDLDLAVHLRSSLENAAQRKLGLVTDHALTPEITTIAIQGSLVPVQRVTLRASGESLVALVTWLGEAESRFPLARVEHWEIAATGGKNTALKLTLAHPLSESLFQNHGPRNERKQP